ncbi:MAG: hypothetical protein H6707_10270 [Deltaproteobacteria bacterium]|nr:hypothetical protein [Deltaproteobacteria bacterium]
MPRRFRRAPEFFCILLSVGLLGGCFTRPEGTYRGHWTVECLERHSACRAFERKKSKFELKLRGDRKNKGYRTEAVRVGGPFVCSLYLDAKLDVVIARAGEALPCRVKAADQPWVEWRVRGKFELKRRWLRFSGEGKPVLGSLPTLVYRFVGMRAN